MKPLSIAIVTPAAAGTRHGNRRTALRWSRHLRDGGHRVSIMTGWTTGGQDVMIALHARRSHASIRAWREQHPNRPLILVLTGTDLYRDIRTDGDARESLRLADRLVVLQTEGLRELPPPLRRKAVVIHQSTVVPQRGKPPRRHLLVTVLGHLRAEKDPFRAAYALQHLPGARLQVVQLGGAMDKPSEKEARALERADSRYRWPGNVPHARAMRWLARSHVMVISSRMEGGAHVVSEAIAMGVPVIASRIPGNVGLLGRDYKGYFPVENERALARLLAKAIEEPAFLAGLARSVRKQAHLTRPATERRALLTLIREISA